MLRSSILIAERDEGQRSSLQEMGVLSTLMRI